MVRTDSAGRGARAAVGDADVPAAAPRRTSPTFRGDVEGLRAVAIGLVLLFHSGAPWAKGGFVGVDVFFVVSGFLITGLLVRELGRSGRIRLVDFYARRARRILPAAAFVLLVTMAAGLAVMPDEQRDALGLDAFASAFQMANWHFLSFTTVELIPRQEASPVLHYWSLAVEEQFYLFWPLTIIAVVAVARRRGRDWRRALVSAAVVITAASLLLSVLITPSHRLLAYLGSPTRAWQFGAGALLAILAGPVAALAARAASRWLGAVLGWLGLAAVVSCLFWANRVPYPGWAAIVPTAGTVAILLSGALAPSRVAFARVLGLPPVRFLGRVSYSLYLWHVLATSAVIALTGRDDWPTLLAAECLAVLPAWLTMVFVEQPFRYGRIAAGPRRGLIVGGVATVVTAAAAAVLAG